MNSKPYYPYRRRIRNSGRTAARQGAARYCNPYMPGRPEHAWWRQGWNEAAEDAGYLDNNAVRTDYAKDSH